MVYDYLVAITYLENGGSMHAEENIGGLTCLSFKVIKKVLDVGLLPESIEDPRLSNASDVVEILDAHHLQLTQHMMERLPLLERHIDPDRLSYIVCLNDAGIVTAGPASPYTAIIDYLYVSHSLECVESKIEVMNLTKSLNAYNDLQLCYMHIKGPFGEVRIRKDDLRGIFLVAN